MSRKKQTETELSCMDLFILLAGRIKNAMISLHILRLMIVKSYTVGNIILIQGDKKER